MAPNFPLRTSRVLCVLCVELLVFVIAREDHMRLQNKVGIVSAAASGMGRAGVLRFAREGAAVGVADIDQAGVEAVVAEITAAGGRALALVGDLRQDSFARDIVRRTANAFGGLDFVWNHVGHPGPASIEGIEMADYELAMDLNLRTVLVTTEAAIPEMRARGGGALLYTASTSGIQGSAFSPVYSMAKFGVVGFVRALAKRLAPDNIRVNAVCPGPIDTPMLRIFLSRPDQQSPTQDKEALIVQRSQQVPMKRTGKPEEIANAALFLLSDEASFVPGAALQVDGGADACFS